MNPSFAGIYVALTTPFDNDEVSPSKLQDNIRAFNRFDLAGYVVLGSTGESVLLSDAESERLVAAAVEAAAPGRTVIVGTARESTRLTVEFTNTLAAMGAQAALVRTPAYYKSRMTAEAQRAYFRSVADGSRLPVLIYHFPQNTGLTLDSRTVVELAEHPNIAGIKDSSGNLSALGEVLPHVRQDFSFLLGTGSLVLPGLLLGAEGAILAMANAAPELCGRLYQLYGQGRLEEAKKLQLDLAPLNKAVVPDYGIPGLKFAMDLQGYHGGPVRPPLLPLSEKGCAEIAAILNGLGLIRR